MGKSSKNGEKDGELSQKEVKADKALAKDAGAAADAAPQPDLAQVARSLMMLPVMWGIGKVDWTTDFAITALPITAVTVISLCLMLVQYTITLVEKKNDKTRLANPGPSSGLPKADDGSVSYAEYDLTKLKESRQQLLMSCLIVGGMYLKMGYVQPLVISCIMQPLQLYDNKALHVHILGRTGDKYERPWASNQSNPLQNWAEKKKAEAEKQAVSLGESVTSYFGSAAGKKKEGSYTVIFKSGDDLRQDQLIMQMIGVMDKLLKRLNFDLKLTPFRVLATSTQDGLMEFVANSYTVSSVLAKHDNNILAFFRSHYPAPNRPDTFGVEPEVLDTYVKSTAGYCVITYLLGIGDRHLDNLMLKATGHLFHLDFGYIFGRDPKPYPPPFKLTREMVDGMGGPESEHYQRFQVYCCQAYNWLRKSASLILNLLNLMVDAGIEDLSQDADATLLKVQEKFRLDLSDEEAEHWFIYLITESVSALFPRMMEILHRGAVALR